MNGIIFFVCTEIMEEKKPNGFSPEMWKVSGLILYGIRIWLGYLTGNCAHSKIFLLQKFIFPVCSLLSISFFGVEATDDSSWMKM